MRHLRRAMFLQFGGVVGGAGIFLLLSRFLPVGAWIDAVQERVMQWGAWSAICYPLLYACCNVLLLPGGVLSVGGGFFFGLWWGFLITLVGNVTGAAIAFFISRYLGKRWLERKLRQNATLKA